MKIIHRVTALAAGIAIAGIMHAAEASPAFKCVYAHEEATTYVHPDGTVEPMAGWVCDRFTMFDGDVIHVEELS